MNSHTAATDAVKKALTDAPVLRYYDVTKPLTIQCDASDTGLGGDNQSVTHHRPNRYREATRTYRDGTSVNRFVM